MVGQKPSLNPVTFTLFSRSQNSFEMATYARWSRSISEKIIDVSLQNFVQQKVTKVIYVGVYPHNLLRTISLTKFRTGTQRGKE